MNSTKLTLEERIHFAHRQHLMDVASATAAIWETLPAGDARQAHLYAIRKWCYHTSMAARQEFWGMIDAELQQAVVR